MIRIQSQNKKVTYDKKLPDKYGGSKSGDKKLLPKPNIPPPPKVNEDTKEKQNKNT